MDNAPAHYADCRGVAGLIVPDQMFWRVARVPVRKEGYCRRNTCECCAPEPRAEGGPSHGGNWCSCRAIQDELCRRCWIDFHVGRTWEANRFYEPVL